MRILAGTALIALACLAPLTSGGESDYPGADQPAMLGGEIRPPSQDSLLKNGLTADQGVEFVNIFPDTAAQRMGMKPGDVVTAINGTTVSSMSELRNEVGISRPGDPVEVVVMRDGQQLALHDTFSPWPPSIPRDPIDAAAERRYRDWLQRRTERAAEQVRDLAQRAEAAAQALAARSQPPRRFELPPGTAGLAAALALPADDALASLPAWHLRARALVELPAMAPVAAPTAAAPVAAGPAFRLRVRLGDAGDHP